MKNFLILVFLLTGFASLAQVEPIYYPEADAQAEIDAAVQKAAAEGKNVFLQIGGNWCVWCRKYHQFITDDPEISQYIADNFVVVKVNYSKENKNEAVFEKLEFPQRFGFPVFVVLDATGRRIHTQNSAYLESGSGYDKEKVMNFYKQWSPAALNPANYRK
ncbi:MAG: thioredoxin family protein [Mangrovibacterium sp.]